MTGASALAADANNSIRSKLFEMNDEKSKAFQGHSSLQLCGVHVVGGFKFNTVHPYYFVLWQPLIKLHGLVSPRTNTNKPDARSTLAGAALRATQGSVLNGDFDDALDAASAKTGRKGKRVTSGAERDTRRRSSTTYNLT